MGNPANTFTAKSAAFVANSTTLNMTDLIHAKDAEGGDLVKATTDQAQTVNGAFLDSIVGEINITVTDDELSTNAAAVVGAVGSLTVLYQRRTQGKGWISGHTLTVTYANALLQRIERDAANVQMGTMVLSFVGYDPAGTSINTKAVA